MLPFTVLGFVGSFWLIPQGVGFELVDPDEDGSREADGGPEGVSATVIAHGGAPPVLEPAEHVLDAVPMAMERSLILDALLAATA